MTTIAYCNGVLAADTQINSPNSCPAGTIEKIGRLGDGSLWAFSGDTQMQEACVLWATGDRRANPPEMTDSGVLVLISPEGRVREWWGRGWIEARDTAHVWGSGERPARGAMMAGAGPQRAVEIAVMLDGETGGEITVLSHALADAPDGASPRQVEGEGSREEPLAYIKGLSHPVRILATHNGMAWVSGCIDNPTDAEHDNGRLVRVADLGTR